MISFNISKSYLSFALAATLFVVGCKKDDPIVTPDSPAALNGEVANSWFDLERKLVKSTPGYTPPVAARAYAYIGLALYESVCQGSSDYRSMKGQIASYNTNIPLETGAEYDWMLVANASLAQMTRKMFPTTSAANKTSIDSLENVYVRTSTDPAITAKFDRSIAYGKAVADAVFAYAATDGQELCYTTNFPTSYVPPVGDGFWVPTAANQRCMQPYWGGVRTFIPYSTQTVKVSNPLTFSTATTSPFYAQAQEVYETVSKITPEQTVIAKFWSDDPGKTGTPSGHSISILTQVLRKENSSLMKAAEGYCKLGMALHDGFVNCWKTKYEFNLMRPVSYIQQNINPAFTTILNTPPFPEYTSGHSVQSGAMAVVMSQMFGRNYRFTDNTHASRTDIDGTPRVFNSFEAAAQEAALSRLYGGIHYRKGIEEGVSQGTKVGSLILTLRFKR